jgi:hypothetical protein
VQAAGARAHCAQGGRQVRRTFLADAVCWGWLASARMAKPPAEVGPETKFLIRCIAFTWLPLTGARTRREGVVESFSMSDACCLATGSAAPCCGCCLFDEPMRKTLLSIVSREKRPGRGAARAGWPLSESVGGGSLRATACAARCLLFGEVRERRGVVISSSLQTAKIWSWKSPSSCSIQVTGSGDGLRARHPGGLGAPQMRECRVSVSPANFERAAGHPRVPRAAFCRACLASLE